MAVAGGRHLSRHAATMAEKVGGIPLVNVFIAFLMASIMILAGFSSMQWSRQSSILLLSSSFHGIGHDVASPTPSSSPSRLTNSVVPSDVDFDLTRTGFTVSSEVTSREYTFNITLEAGDPDGVEKPMILINGQSPGPLIEANIGDIIRVTVNNLMEDEQTTIHWHGIDQRDTVWMDGVHGVTQCGIPPGETFVYEFSVAEQRGTFWYHAHVSVQYTDGLYGPLVGYPSPSHIEIATADPRA